MDSSYLPCFEKAWLELHKKVLLFYQIYRLFRPSSEAKLDSNISELRNGCIIAIGVHNLYNNMSLRLFCIILIFWQACSLDYQDRAIYYSQQDNVCHVAHDNILLRINLDGKETVTHKVWGETTCSEGHIYYWQIVSPAEQFADSGQDHYIYFSQETKRVYVLGRLHQIVQRTKVVNATFNETPYHCEIIGDGTIQHFGIDIPDSPPCTHYLKCNKMSTKYD